MATIKRKRDKEKIELPHLRMPGVVSSLLMRLGPSEMELQVEAERVPKSRLRLKFNINNWRWAGSGHTALFRKA